VRHPSSDASHAADGTIRRNERTLDDHALPRAGDLESLVAWKGPQMVRLARALLRDEHQAEDVVQDVLAVCVTKWTRIQSLDDPSAYLNRMVVNAVTNSRRRPWRREHVSDPADLPDRGVSDSTGPFAERQRCGGIAYLRHVARRGPVES